MGLGNALPILPRVCVNRPQQVFLRVSQYVSRCICGKAAALAAMPGVIGNSLMPDPVIASANHSRNGRRVRTRPRSTCKAISYGEMALIAKSSVASSPFRKCSGNSSGATIH